MDIERLEKRNKYLKEENEYLKDKIRKIAYLCDHSYIDIDETFANVFEIVSSDTLQMIAGYSLENGE